LVYPSQKISKFEELAEDYLQALKKHLDLRKKELDLQTIKTIYLGGGTPLELGESRILELLKYITQLFPLQQIEEINIELNPSPSEQVLALIQKINKEFSQALRLRYSI